MGWAHQLYRLDYLSVNKTIETLFDFSYGIYLDKPLVSGAGNVLGYNAHLTNGFRVRKENGGFFPVALEEHASPVEYFDYNGEPYVFLQNRSDMTLGLYQLVWNETFKRFDLDFKISYNDLFFTTVYAYVIDNKIYVFGQPYKTSKPSLYQMDENSFALTEIKKLTNSCAEQERFGHVVDKYLFYHLPNDDEPIRRLDLKNGDEFIFSNVVNQLDRMYGFFGKKNGGLSVSGINASEMKTVISDYYNDGSFFQTIEVPIYTGNTVTQLVPIGN